MQNQTLSANVTADSMLSARPVTLSMPAEWELHERCLMSWPSRDYWDNTELFARAKLEWAAVANAIARFEPVLMIAAPGMATEARGHLEPNTKVLELPLDDAWIRDNGPIFVLGPDGQREGLHFGFNAWGKKFPPWDRDADLARPLLEHLGIPRRVSRLILEGGSIIGDGQGTLIVTEQCLLHSNRNPNWSSDQIERELIERFAVTKVIWLPFGHADDAHTDGHVDGVLAYLAPAKVLVQVCHDRNHPDHERMRRNLRVLRETTDARGRPFEIIELPFYPRFEVAGLRDMVSYVNLYIANGPGGCGVIVPLANSAMDPQALEIIQNAMPGFEVVGVPGQMIALGGGGPHCITQQVPAVRP